MEYLIVGILVVLSGCFSGLTLGFFSLNVTALERKIKLGDKRAIKVYPIRKRGNLLLCTLLIGNVAVNSAAAIFLGEIASGLVAGVISTVLIVIFGEILPQAFFSRFALTLGAKTVWLVKIFIFIMYPLAYPLSLVLDKLLGEELQTIWSKREIKEIIKHHENNEASDIDEDEERIMIGALSFSEVLVKKIMTPKPVLFKLEKTQVLDKTTLIEIRNKGFTRIPIYEIGEDNLVGVLYSKDLIGLFEENKTVADFISKTKPIFAKDTMRLDTLMNRFIDKKVHIAFVHDEYSTFIGIVTLEDIIEEILKVEIVDEVDFATDMQHFALEQTKRTILES
ncbi:Magnesium and cobalt efflux protein CorC [Kordia antarctica]|uniref:Magnesium and cobalt efflux protein CorC n=1 Tax=Kordia antarctica TaxID=1218801 RepID=A0A7L4ZR07_9FLAO|nr:CNNM domain-containing protein [Kordia antarctica]QHI39128.1 Magnesium and cobalt efflux protein CorC [Kordia antarctica]